jgi:hypothetical protein
VEAPPVASSRNDLSGRIVNALRDAGETLLLMVRDPVGQMTAGFSKLGAGRAGDAGVILCVISALLMALGLTVGVGNVLGAFALGVSSFGRSSISLFFLTLIRFLVMAAVMIGIITKIAGLKGPLGQELFTIGVALAPLGVVVLLAGLLAGSQLAWLLLMFAVIMTVMLVLTGLAGVCGFSSKLTSIGVPVVLIAGMWLTSLIFNAVG